MSNKKETPFNDKKKIEYKSPGQKYRDYTRKKNYIEQEMKVPNSEENSEKPEVKLSVVLYCNVCDFTTTSTINLNTHTISKHSFKVIEQLDGQSTVKFV